ncbi:hypothetical protein [Mucilaginibacter xinganensis]|uniref:Cytochrome c domain-containing protein n=1 Tax=Mucilaginibacter xinganensis TaxID=1234841 RepID=A0A223P3Z2_9SPHI|nr:hypothetical protein [Mucilaginibacter xinganensis]ASU36750.1 hypothetical protein MuYL_4867 [Mucilaginibacter xinganensis]
MKIRHLLFLAALLTGNAGCYYDHANLVYPQQSTAACITTNVTYSTTVTGVLTANCYSCHSGNAAAGGGIALDTYASLKTYVTNGQLINSINHTGGIPAMPLNAAQLSQCDINKIQAWITNGSPNN